MSHFWTLVKTFSWRGVGAADTFVLAWLITGHVGAASTIMGLEVVTKTVLYYGHERVWHVINRTVGS